MKLTQSTRASNRGFSIPEVLISGVLGMLVVGMCLSTSIPLRTIYLKDVVRTRVNQNLRGAMDIIGADIRVAGENLGVSFPAIEITNGASGATDEISLRRNLIDEVLPLCQSITTSPATSRAYFAIPGNISGCIYSGHTHDYNSWKAYREAQPNQVALAYIYDSSAKVGEFFSYGNEDDDGTSYYIEIESGNFANNYSAGSTAIYILEESRYRVNNGMLQLIENGDVANALNVSFDIADFQVQALMQDGTTKTAFTSADSWITIKTIETALSGNDNVAGEVYARTLIGQFFPRNVLSN